jgi:hypothetical protein
MLLDVVGASLLAVYALIIGPLGVLRGPIVFERAVWYLWVLTPQGLLTRAIRAAIDWRLGNFDTAIAQLEGLVGTSEEYYKDRRESRARRRVLEDFYTVLARAYLHAGHIDDAMLVVIRAKKSMGIERLSGLAELDAKTAHLVRAGLAAGRLLEGGGLATMFVRSSPQQEAQAKDRKDARESRRRKDPTDPKVDRSGTPKSARPGRPAGETRQGATAKPPAPPPPATAEVGGPGAKIIPFPVAPTDQSPH